jgi:MFS family permease
MVVLELTSGVIGDLFGRKRLLQAGALLTVAGSVVSYFAGTVRVLWIGQVVAGVGAAMLYPISPAMLAAVSSSPQARAKVIAVWAGFLSIGAAISPLLGGWLAGEGSWRTSYLVVVVVPLRLAGMASATTNLLRDFGFALGPVLIAAFAVSRANGDMAGGLGRALSESGLPSSYTGVARGAAHDGGAMAINSLPVVPGPSPHLPRVPMPPSLRALAFESLGSAYSFAFLIAGLCAAGAAVLTLVGLFCSHRAVDEPSLPDAEFAATG